MRQRASSDHLLQLIVPMHSLLTVLGVAPSVWVDLRSTRSIVRDRESWYETRMPVASTLRIRAGLSPGPT